MFKMSTGDSWKQNPTNPNPKSFIILKMYCFSDMWVAEIKYPNCTNFEGIKILVLREDPSGMSEIDPHFYEQGPIVARFEPNDNGWNQAMWFAETFSKKD